MKNVPNPRGVGLDDEARERSAAARRELLLAKLPAYLDALAKTGAHTKASRAVGAGTSAYKYWLGQSKDDPAAWTFEWEGTEAPFHEHVTTSLEMFADHCVAAIDEMADGVVEDVWHGGKKVGTRLKRDVIAAIFRAKAATRRVGRMEFIDQAQVQHEHRGTVQIESARERLADKLLMAIERRALADANPETIDVTPVREALPAATDNEEK